MLKKLERRIFFWTPRNYHQMNSGQNFFVATATFVEKHVSLIFCGFSKNFKKFIFFWKVFYFKKRNLIIELLNKYPITENQKWNYWRDLLDKWLLLPKKSELDLVRKNTIETNCQNRDETKKKRIEPKSFYRERWTIQEGFIFFKKKNEK